MALTFGRIGAAFFSLAVATALPLAGPASAAGQITVGVGDNILGLDPTDLNDSVSLSASRLFFQGLYGFDRELKLVPVLAESTEVNGDSTQYTVHLRRGVKFHDGTSFDAAAVKLNYDRLRDPANRLKRQSLLEAVDKVGSLSSPSACAQGAIGVLLNHLCPYRCVDPEPPAIANMARICAIRSAPGRSPSRADARHAQSGAQFDHWRATGRARRRHDPQRSRGARLALLRSGEAQFVFPPPPETVQLIERDERLVIDKMPPIGRNMSRSTPAGSRSTIRASGRP